VSLRLLYLIFVRLCG